MPDTEEVTLALVSVELEGLIRAHNSITTYLDGCSTMHSEGYRR